MGSSADREIAARCVRVAEELRRREPLLVDNGQHREPPELEVSNGQMETRLRPRLS